MDQSVSTDRVDAPSMDRLIAKKRRKWLPWAGAGVAAVLAGAYVALGVGPGARAVEASNLEIAAAVQAPFQDYVPARGEIAPLQTVYVDAIEGGQIARRVAEDGDVVAAGALLAVLQNPQLQLQVGAREAEVTGRISDVRGQLLALRRNRADRDRELQQARYERLRAEQNLSVRRSLHEKGFAADVELKTATQEAEFRRTQVASLEQALRQEAQMTAGQQVEIQKTLTQLNENLAGVRRSLDALNVRAPVGGRLTAFELQPGQTIRAGERLGQIDTEGGYKVAAQVDEFYLGRISLGQAAVARHEGKAYPLKVSRIFPQVRNGRFQTELTFAGALPAAVRRGQSLEVEITLGDTRPALVLPNAPFMEATGGNWAFVLAPGGRAERRAIRTGRRNPHQVEVLGGLKAGERVITSPYDGFLKETRLVLR
jgi:HlyD family secretion protein